MTFPRPAPEVWAIQRFFRRTPMKPTRTAEILFLAGGGCAFLVAMASVLSGISENTPWTAVCCAVIFGVPGVVLASVGVFKLLAANSLYRQQFQAAEPKPPFEWVNSILIDDLRRIEERALIELRISREELQLESTGAAHRRMTKILLGRPESANDQLKRPLMLVGPARSTVIVFGPPNQGELFSRCLVSVICPTSWQFGIYECVLDLATGNLTMEQARQYPYTQVSAVTTRTVPVTWQRDQPRPLDTVGGELTWSAIEYRDLEVLVTGGDRAVMTLGLIDRSLARNYGSGLMIDGNSVIDEVRNALKRRDMRDATP